MSLDRRRFRHLGLPLAALILATVLPSAYPPTDKGAVPVAQAQPSPASRVTATPEPTQSIGEQIQDLERRKLNHELRLIDGQLDRLKQEQAIDSQAWRAPAAAVAAFGPTLVGLGALYLLARALSHWISPSQELEAEEEEEEDEL